MFEMVEVLAQITQMPGDDEGGGWGRLAWLLILIVVPLVNAIKDWFVKRAEEKRVEEAAGEASKKAAQLELRPVQPKLKTAKPLRPGAAIPRPAASTRSIGTTRPFTTTSFSTPIRSWNVTSWRRCGPVTREAGGERCSSRPVAVVVCSPSWRERCRERSDHPRRPI